MSLPGVPPIFWDEFIVDHGISLVREDHPLFSETPHLGLGSMAFGRVPVRPAQEGRQRTGRRRFIRPSRIS